MRRKRLWADKDVLSGKRILLMPGHVNHTTGALILDSEVTQGTGYVSEAEVNFDIAIAVARCLWQCGTDTYLTTGNWRRKRLIAERFQPEITLEIHCNAFQDPDVRGFEVWYDNDEMSEQLARALTVCLQALEIPPRKNPIRRMDADSNEGDWRDKHDALFEHVKARPLVLLELGFLTNREDLRLLTSSRYQLSLAFLITWGIKRFFCSRKNSGSGAGGGMNETCDV